MNAYITDMARYAEPGTAKRHAYAMRLFRRYVDAVGLRLDVADLSIDHLKGFHSWLSRADTARHGHKREASSVRKIVEPFQVFWRWLADESPWADVIPRPRTIKMRKDEAGPVLAPTWEEMDAVVEAAFGWRRKLAAMLRSTGLRPFQVMLAKWDDVDLERAEFVVRHGKTAAEKAGRIVPLAKHLVREMATWGKREGWLIETGLDTERERQSRGREMLEAWERAGVRPVVWEDRPHRAFRAGFISGLKALGANDEAVKFLVGHDLGTRGAYLDPRVLRSAVDLIPAPGKRRVRALKSGSAVAR